MASTLSRSFASISSSSFVLAQRMISSSKEGRRHATKPPSRYRIIMSSIICVDVL